MQNKTQLILHLAYLFVILYADYEIRKIMRKLFVLAGMLIGAVKFSPEFDPNDAS